MSILLRPDDLGKEACDEKEKNKENGIQMNREERTREMIGNPP